MTETVLCTIDDQEHSSLAVDHAIGLTRDLSARLVVLMVNHAVLPARGSAVYRWENWQIETYFAEARKRAWFGGVGDIECIAPKSLDIVETVLSVAKRLDARKLVVGSDYRKPRFGRWREPLSWQLSCRAPCPTTIVHNHLKHNLPVVRSSEGTLPCSQFTQL